MINPYGPVGGSPIKLCLAHKLVLPKPQYWTLTDAESGQIHALDRVAGIKVATNGILVAILTPTLHILIGHAEWWEPQKNEAVVGHASRKAKDDTQVDISEYV
jgi:hypothetical protein